MEKKTRKASHETKELLPADVSNVNLPESKKTVTSFWNSTLTTLEKNKKHLGASYEASVEHVNESVEQIGSHMANSLHKAENVFVRFMDGTVYLVKNRTISPLMKKLERGFTKAMGKVESGCHSFFRHTAQFSKAVIADLKQFPLMEALPEHHREKVHRYDWKNLGSKKNVFRVAAVAGMMMVAFAGYYFVNPPVTYATYINGQLVGYMEEPGKAEEVLALLEQEAEAEAGKDLKVARIKDLGAFLDAEYKTKSIADADTTLYADFEITYEEVMKQKGMPVADEETLTKSFESSLVLLESAASINVDGEPIAYAETAEEAQFALDTYIAQFTTGRENVTIVEATTVEDVEIDTVDVVYGTKLLAGDDLLSVFKNPESDVATYTISTGDSLWSIASANRSTVSELVALNPGIDNKTLLQGDVINLSKEVAQVNVKTVEKVEYEEVIPYKTIYQEDPTLPAGTTKVKVTGVTGLKLVSSTVTRVNGEKEVHHIDSVEILDEAIDEVILKGTKKVVVSSGGTTAVNNGEKIGTGRFIWPTKATYISSPYGRRGREMHTGTDIAGKSGDAIWAADSGVVVYAGYRKNSYGYYVIIDHGNGYKTHYAHNKALLVQAGDVVEQGDTIAYMGRTGRATGNHLHFEVSIHGDFVNPMKYFR